MSDKTGGKPPSPFERHLEQLRNRQNGAPLKDCAIIEQVASQSGCTLIVGAYDSTMVGSRFKMFAKAPIRRYGIFLKSASPETLAGVSNKLQIKGYTIVPQEGGEIRIADMRANALPLEETLDDNMKKLFADLKEAGVVPLKSGWVIANRIQDDTESHKPRPSVPAVQRIATVIDLREESADGAGEHETTMRSPWSRRRKRDDSPPRPGQ